MASVLKVDKLDPQSGTALELGTSGDTISVPSGATLDISASTLTPPATMPASSAANLTSIPAANLTGTIAAISGANLTSLTATNLSSGTVPTARLGSGTASSSTILYGDQTYKAEPGGGKIVQTKMEGNYNWSGDASSSSETYAGFGNEIVITPTSSSNALIFHMMISDIYFAGNEGMRIDIYDKTNATWVGGSLSRKASFHAGSTTALNIPFTLMEILETAGADARTYQGYFRTETAGETVYINNGGSNGFVRFCIMEVVKDD